MRDERWDGLEAAGIDVKRTLERFMGNEGLYIKFLAKFCEDMSFDGLRQAVDMENFDEMIDKSHTLKGLSANLGMVELASACGEMIFNIRQGITANKQQDYERIKKVYFEIINALQKSDIS